MTRAHSHSNITSADCAALLGDPRLGRVSNELASLCRPSIRLLAEPSPHEPGIGSSKLGGCPDLAVGVPWPTCHIDMPAPSEAFLKARPDERRLPPDGVVHLAFIAQINLEEIQPFDTESRLPESGLLSFFYNPQFFASDRSPFASGRDGISGFSYGLHGYDNIKNWQVIHTPPGATLERREFPSTLHDGVKYKPHGIVFRHENTVPSIETSFLPGPDNHSGLIDMTEEEWDAFRALRYELRANHSIHQMLGFADQWATTSDEGSYWRVREALFPDEAEWESLPKEGRIATAGTIRLLLQVNIFDDAADWWGRNGLLYFFIRDTELAQRDFSKVWGTTE